MYGTRLTRVGNYLTRDNFKQLGSRSETAWICMYRVWRECVGEAIANHSRPTGWRGNTLIIHVDSPAWAGKIRRQKQQFLTKLRKVPLFSQLETLQLKIRPMSSTIPPIAQSRYRSDSLKLSDTAVALIRDLAENVHTPELRSALLRLAASKEDTTSTK